MKALQHKPDDHGDCSIDGTPYPCDVALGALHAAMTSDPTPDRHREAREPTAEHKPWERSAAQTKAADRERWEAAAARETWWRETPSWPYPTNVGSLRPMTDAEWLAQAFREAVSRVHDLGSKAEDDPMNAIIERSAAEGDERAKALLPTLRHANIEDADYGCEHPFCARWWPMVRAAEARARLAALSPAGPEEPREIEIAKRLIERLDHAAVLASTPATDADPTPDRHREARETLDELDRLVLSGELDCLRSGTLIRLRDLLASPADSLDEAWKEAEAALPEGWHMGEVKNTSYRGVNAAGDSERWLAMAWAEADERTFQSGYGDTPVLALRALTAALSKGKP